MGKHRLFVFLVITEGNIAEFHASARYNFIRLLAVLIIQINLRVKNFTDTA